MVFKKGRELNMNQYKKLAKAVPAQLKSRKLWLSLIAAFVGFGNGMWDWGLSNEEVGAVILPLVAYIAAEGVADTAERMKK